jgi:hypothetical protein
MNQDRRLQTAPVIGGLLLIMVGVVFLLANVLNWNIFDALWPFFIIALGAAFFVGMAVGGKPAGALAIPGSILVILGLIFLWQNAFDRWGSWTYIWTLIAPTGVGIGLLIFSWWSDKPNLKRPGYILIAIGLTLFIVFGAFFEVLFGLTGLADTSMLFWPIVLIGAGALLLLGRFVNFERVIEQLPPHNSHHDLPGTTVN